MQARRRGWWWRCIGAFAVLAACVVTDQGWHPAVAHGSGADVRCPGGWRIDRSLEVPSSALLGAVSGTSASDVWVVGSQGKTGVAAHWNGAAWRPTPVGDGLLFGAASVAPDDVWAVGENGKGTLTEHWDGARWTTTRSPTRRDARLLAVAGSSANDVWATGYYDGPLGVTHTIAEHWDGTAWTVSPSQDPGSMTNELAAVSSVSPSDVWAVGVRADGQAPDAILIEQWNGSAWSVVPGQDPGPGGSSLTGVSAASSADAWAVGSQVVGSSVQTLIERWDGSTWSIVPSPDEGTASVLQAVWSDLAGDAWAVGFWVDAAGVVRTLAERWDGAAWSVVATPNAGSGAQLVGVWASGANRAVSVGYAFAPDGRPEPLVERSC